MKLADLSGPPSSSWLTREKSGEAGSPFPPSDSVGLSLGGHARKGRDEGCPAGRVTHRQHQRAFCPHQETPLDLISFLCNYKRIT